MREETLRRLGQKSKEKSSKSSNPHKYSEKLETLSKKLVLDHKNQRKDSFQSFLDTMIEINLHITKLDQNDSITINTLKQEGALSIINNCLFGEPLQNEVLTRNITWICCNLCSTYSKEGLQTLFREGIITNMINLLDVNNLCIETYGHVVLGLFNLVCEDDSIK